MKNYTKQPIEKRFWSKVNKTDTCWLWTAYITKNGYGQFGLDGKVEYAHRVAYNLEVGPISEGMMLDHICHAKHCVNPKHLREVTRKQNAENLAGTVANNTSGYHGVYWDKQAGKWSAKVKHEGRQYYAGFFSDVHEAGEAARLKRIELFTHNNTDRMGAA